MENVILCTAYEALDLIKCCFEPEKEIPSVPQNNYSCDQLLSVSESLGIASLTAYALKRQGAVTPDSKLILARAQRRNLLLNAEYNKISNELKKRRVVHLPLKGIILKDLYPSVGLREMTDIDIWFDADRSDDVKAVMESLGYSAKYFGVSKHDVYTKPPMFCVEMHRQLIDSDVLPESVDYYSEQWDRLIREKKEGEYGLTQRHEDFYIYVIAHAYKHYLIAGIGVRLLLDVYVMLQKWNDMDLSYIKQECRKQGFAEFEDLARRISIHLFDREKLGQEDSEHLDDFILSGVHGNTKKYYQNAIGQSESKQAYIRSRLKTTDKQLENHPFLLRHKVLRPLYLPVRFIDALFKRRKLLRTELKTLYRFKKDDKS